MIWNDKRSVLKHGSKEISCGDVVPAEVIEAMGKSRVKELTDKKVLKKGSTVKEPTSRELLVAKAKEMGLKHAPNITEKKLVVLVEGEVTRLNLLDQAKELKLDVAEDATAQEIATAIAAAGE